MWKFIFFVYFFSISISHSAEPNFQTEIPKNLVQDYIKNNANFSVDPCDDFYAHVCPNTTKVNFMMDLMERRNRIIAEYELSLSEQEFSASENIEMSETLRNFIDSDDVLDLCHENDEVMWLFTSNFVTITDNNQKFSCEDAVAKIRETGSVDIQFVNSREKLRKAKEASIANIQLNKNDQKLRNLFNKLKLAVSKQLKKTPWVNNNGGIELYLDALEKIDFTTFADMQETVREAIEKYRTSRNECFESLHGTFSDEIKNVICEVIGIGEGNRILEKPSEKIHEIDRNGVLEDHLQMWNSEDDRVYVGNDFLLLANTDYLSDFYGSIGFSLIHEILHTLVLDDEDIKEQKPLVPFWTKDSKCVEEQTQKTCETYRTNFQHSKMLCSTKMTFEEDAADLAAYRIAWDIYQREYTRKTTVSNYESLNKKQLFFYGAAVFFCKPHGMDQTFGSWDSHSNNYQRVNSLMSQMDQFSDAFKCKSTDRIVMNKGRHCELFGSKAERKHSVV